MDDGDNMMKGTPLYLTSKISAGSKISVFIDRKSYSKKTQYMSRLDVVKKLFDSFVNRSIAYSFNSAIGLMSFSTKSKLECDISPFYETFRNDMEKLKTSGSTALYESLKDAGEKLIAWKNMDLDKRKNAVLRVICLSDGYDTGNSYTTKHEVEKKFLQNNIILDCIAIGSEYDDYLGKISKKIFQFFVNGPVG